MDKEKPSSPQTTQTEFLVRSFMRKKLLFLTSFCAGSPPASSAWMMASRCFARASPWSAARTYQTCASIASRWQPMPCSLKYPAAYCALGRPNTQS